MRRVLALIVSILAAQAGVLFLYGQPLICRCGTVKLWEGIVASPEMSQHLTDWYTFSHIIHGFLFYALLWYFFPRTSWWWRLTLAAGIEASWELIENTPMVIEHYRQQALAHGYIGDSILNSLSDTCAMIIGFLVARKLPVIATIVIALALEAMTLYFIRDSLGLNILNLIHVFPAVASWQSAAQ